MVQDAWPSLYEQGIGPQRDAIVSAAAVGLVEWVWRNSPVEDAHASRRGPHDGQMMAQSLYLHAVAVTALSRATSGSAVLAFERHVLDFDRVWHGTDRTVKDMLWGHLGEFRKHVKAQTNTLMWIEDEGGPDVLLGFLCLLTRQYGSSHHGMPAWPSLVAGSVDHLSRPDDPCWAGRHDVARVSIRAHHTGSWAALGRTLCESPRDLDPELLDALIGAGVFHFGERMLRDECF